MALKENEKKNLHKAKMKYGGWWRSFHRVQINEAKEMQGVCTLIGGKIHKVWSLTVFDSSLPISIVRKHRGIISVERRKLITSVSSTCKTGINLNLLNLELESQNIEFESNGEEKITSFLLMLKSYPSNSILWITRSDSDFLSWVKPDRFQIEVA